MAGCNKRALKQPRSQGLSSYRPLETSWPLIKRAPKLPQKALSER